MRDAPLHTDHIKLFNQVCHLTDSFDLVLAANLIVQHRWRHEHTVTLMPQRFEQRAIIKLTNNTRPEFVFGYGLSYTQFAYNHLTVSSNQIKPGQSITVSVEVSNQGNYDGKEVVQLYLRDVVGSVTRPLRELKAFNKITLAKGEKKIVTFTLTEEDLKFYNSDLNFVAEPGVFEIFVGGNSDASLKETFELIEP